MRYDIEERTKDWLVSGHKMIPVSDMDFYKNELMNYMGLSVIKKYTTTIAVNAG